MVLNKVFSRRYLTYIKVFILTFFAFSLLAGQVVYAAVEADPVTVAPTTTSGTTTTTTTTNTYTAAQTAAATAEADAQYSSATSGGTGLATVTSVPDAGTMLMNFAQSLPNLMKLVTALAYVMGIFFIFKGVMGLREFGESRTMMTQGHTLKGPLILIFVGTALLYLPSSVSAGLNTFWSAPNPYGYVEETTDQWSALYQDCFMIIQLIGTIAFIRGLVILTQLGGQGGQPGTFGRGITHIIAGTLCINLYDFLSAISTTFGLGTS
jgi:intracellular multiplication protein IcmC